MPCLSPSPFPRRPQKRPLVPWLAVHDHTVHVKDEFLCRVQPISLTLKDQPLLARDAASYLHVARRAHRPPLLFGLDWIAELTPRAVSASRVA